MLADDNTKRVRSSNSFCICNNLLAGVEGFEPPNAGTRTQCLTTWRHPIGSTIIASSLAELKKENGALRCENGCNEGAGHKKSKCEEVAGGALGANAPNKNRKETKSEHTTANASGG